jgi:hypothetical protein
LHLINGHLRSQTEFWSGPVSWIQPSAEPTAACQRRPCGDRSARAERG